MPRKYKRSKSGKRTLRKSRGGAVAACNAVPNLPYQQPCSVGGVLDSEFANAMKGGAGNSTYRKRSGRRTRSKRSYSRTRRTRRSIKNKRGGAGYSFKGPDPSLPPGVHQYSSQRGGANFNYGCRQPKWGPECR
jgi:hypothetical protein